MFLECSGNVLRVFWGCSENILGKMAIVYEFTVSVFGGRVVDLIDKKHLEVMCANVVRMYVCTCVCMCMRV